MTRLASLPRPRLVQRELTLLTRLRLQRLRAHPLQSILPRLYLGHLVDARPDEFPRPRQWERSLRPTIRALPKGFVSSWSLGAASCQWLYHLTLRQAPTLVLECGGGLSTVVLASAAQRLGAGHGLRIMSLDHDADWLDSTRQALDKLGLTQWVDLRHAPLTTIQSPLGALDTYDLSGLSGLRPQVILIDGPPTPPGRIGVLPALRAASISCSGPVVLDDARRPAEREAVSSWTRRRYCDFVGYVPVGHGLAVLRLLPPT